MALLPGPRRLSRRQTQALRRYSWTVCTGNGDRVMGIGDGLSEYEAIHGCERELGLVASASLQYRPFHKAVLTLCIKERTNKILSHPWATVLCVGDAVLSPASKEQARVDYAPRRVLGRIGGKLDDESNNLWTSGRPVMAS